MSPKVSRRFRQKKCPKSPPCKKGSVQYKMRKSSRKCCRKKSHKRIGPSIYSENKWVKFLKSHSGHKHSRKSLTKMYKVKYQ